MVVGVYERLEEVEHREAADDLAKPVENVLRPGSLHELRDVRDLCGIVSRMLIYLRDLGPCGTDLCGSTNETHVGHEAEAMPYPCQDGLLSEGSWRLEVTNLLDGVHEPREEHDV